VIYCQWIAACKLAAKGHTMADASYETEVQNFRTLIKLQKSGSGNGGGESRVLCHPWIVFND